MTRDGSFAIALLLSLRWGALACGALGCGALGCGALGCGGTIDEEPLPEADVDAYATQVHPILRFSCASLDCHGVDGRPLRLYAEEGLRARDELRGLPLDPEEARWNAIALVGVDPEPTSLDAHLALAKPLARAAGGLEHAGGDIWPTRDDPAYRCVRAWLARESATADATSACAEAAAAVDPRAAGAP